MQTWSRFLRSRDPELLSGLVSIQLNHTPWPNSVLRACLDEPSLFAQPYMTVNGGLEQLTYYLKDTCTVWHSCLRMLAVLLKARFQRVELVFYLRHNPRGITYRVPNGPPLDQMLPMMESLRAHFLSILQSRAKASS